MKRAKKIFPAICCIPLLCSCASTQTGGQAWNIQPSSSVKHAMGNPEAMYSMGRYYQGQKRYDQAIAAYRKALEADPGYVEAMNGMGVVYALQGRRAEAVAQFKAALEIAPNAGHVHNNLGYVLYLQGSYAEAVVALEKAAELEPANRRALNNLGLAHAKAGSAEKSAQAFAAATDTRIEESAQQTAVAAGGEEKPATVAAAVTDPATSPRADAVREPAAMDVVADAAPIPAANNPATPPQSETAELSLALPKDQGVIVQADVRTVPVQESSLETIQVAPDAYELRERVDVPTSRNDGVADSVVEVAANAARVMPVVLHAPDGRKLKVEVSNGNGVTGMARKVSLYLKDAGFPANRLTNQKPFRVASSRVYYRDGYLDQAQQLGGSLPQQPQLIQSNNLRQDIQVRLVLGRDIRTKLAFFDNRSLTVAAAATGKKRNS